METTQELPCIARLKIHPGKREELNREIPILFRSHKLIETNLMQRDYCFSADLKKGKNRQSSGNLAGVFLLLGSNRHPKK